MKMSNTKRSKKTTIIAKIVGGIAVALGLMVAGVVALQPTRRQIVVQHV
jgi:hypothetical protein